MNILMPPDDENAVTEVMCELRQCIDGRRLLTILASHTAAQIRIIKAAGLIDDEKIRDICKQIVEIGMDTNGLEPNVQHVGPPKTLN